MSRELWNEAECCKEAILVQNACNSSGVIHSLDHVVTSLWDVARELGKGTEWVNTHPAIILFIDKLDDLAKYRYTFDKYCQCYSYCEEMAKHTEQEVLEKGLF